MAILSRDEILKVDDRKTEVVPVPEWGGEVIVRSMSGFERDAFEASVAQSKNGKQTTNLSNIRARLVAKCVVDEHNVPLFVTPADVLALGEKSAAALDRVFEKCQELNGMSKKDVEELVEDFGDDPSGDSISD